MQHRASGGVHQGAPGQMTWLEDPRTALADPPCLSIDQNSPEDDYVG